MDAAWSIAIGVQAGLHLATAAALGLVFRRVGHGWVLAAAPLLLALLAQLGLTLINSGFLTALEYQAFSIFFGLCTLALIVYLALGAWPGRKDAR